MPKLIKNCKLALIGLIILFACSLVMAGGGRPPEMYSQFELLPLSPEEKQMIDNAYLQSGDRGEIAKYQRYWYKFEVHTLLKRVFPAVQFYQLNSGITVPETPYIMGYRNGKFYNLPSGFNRLLLDNNLEVNNKNIIELAKAFVVIAFMDNPPIDYSQPNWEDNINRFPEITFLEGKRIKNFKEAKKINKNYQKLMVTDFTYRAYLKIKIGQETQEWYFGVNPQDTGQFGVVNIGIPAKSEFHLRYNLFQGETKSKGKSWDTNPQIHVDSVLGGVYLEKCGDTLRYYLIVSENGEIRGHFPYFSVFFSQII